MEQIPATFNIENKWLLTMEGERLLIKWQRFSAFGRLVIYENDNFIGNYVDQKTTGCHQDMYI